MISQHAIRTPCYTYSVTYADADYSSGYKSDIFTVEYLLEIFIKMSLWRYLLECPLDVLIDMDEIHAFIPISVSRCGRVSCLMCQPASRERFREASDVKLRVAGTMIIGREGAGEESILAFVLPKLRRGKGSILVAFT